MARDLGLPYDEPPNDEERRQYRTAFREVHGKYYELADLDDPRPEMTDEEIEEVITEFLALLNQIGRWGGGGETQKNHDVYFVFRPHTAKGRANAKFGLKVGETYFSQV